MNLMEWARAQGIHVTTAYRWYREGTLPVPARKAVRLILVSPDMAALPPAQGGAGLYARVSSHDQKAGLDRQVARLPAWAAQAGLPVVRVEAEVGSGMNGSRPEVRRLLAGSGVSVVVAGHRDRLGQMNTELAEAALAAHHRRLVVLDESEVTDGLVRDMIEVLTSFCARLYGRRPARNRTLKAAGCAQRDIGPQAVLAAGSTPMRRCRVSGLRPVAAPFVAAAPAGARVRTRLRVSARDGQVLAAAGTHLGSLAGRDLAARCAEGRLDAKGKAGSRAVRKRALTAESSSRWAGAITRTSEDQYRLAEQNLRAGQASLQARIRRIEARLAVPAGGKSGRTRGYATAAERHAKVIRLRSLKARLARAERRLAAGTVSVVRGGRALLRKRANLAAAGLDEDRWRAEWESARLFVTADGEKDKPLGNETIRWHPGEGWLEIRLPAPLTHLANRPHGRYRLSCPVEFSYRRDEVAAQTATGAVRYDISRDPASGRWYLDASWKTSPAPAATLDELRASPVMAVDVNAGYLAVAVAAADGNVLGTPATIPLDLAGLPAATRDGRLRAAISALIATAEQHGARAIVIEDLDFAEARSEGRERHGNRPSRGRRGRAFRRLVAGIPTGKLRDRLMQMAANAGLHVIVVDPAYTSRWGAEHWLGPLREHHPNATGHHAAALVTGRRGLGHRARRRAAGNRTAPEEAARPAQARSRTTPAAGPRTKETRHPRGPRQPPGTKTGRPHRIRAGNQATQDRPGPSASQDHVLLVQ